jgi:signal-transduction protein with cAMP-binding, CBS, and nucleotidyltransferase domain
MIGELCSKPVVTIGRDAPIPQAARLMATHNVGAVVVVNGDTPIGIMTDRDIAVGVVAAGRDVETTTVKEVMHADPRVLREDQGVFDAVKVFNAAGVRRLPVVGRNGTMIGILSLDDVVMLLGNEMAQVSAAVARGLGRPAAAA